MRTRSFLSPASLLKLGGARVTWRISSIASDSAALGWAQDSAFLSGFQAPRLLVDGERTLSNKDLEDSRGTSFCLLCRMVCGSSIPDQGSSPCPLRWKHRALTPGSPGESHVASSCTELLWVQSLALRSGVSLRTTCYQNSWSACQKQPHLDVSFFIFIFYYYYYFG